MKKVFLIVLVLLGIVVISFLLQKNILRSERISLQNLQPPCRIERTCGNLVGVDCASAVDGPYYYVDKNSEKIVEYCGGVCMGSHGKPNGKYCRNCPPKSWTCGTY